LTEINVAPENVKYSSLDGVLFNKEQTTLIKYPIGNPAEIYTIPDSVIRIEDYAFSQCVILTSIVFKSPSPPEFNSNIFWFSSVITAYVPLGSKWLYNKTRIWVVESCFGENCGECDVCSPPPYCFDIFDALYIIEDIVGIAGLTDEQRTLYDFFDDGNITIFNALEIVKFIVGLDSVISSVNAV
jgi:hypothetical protein